MLVVIPSNRSVNLDYVSPLIDAGARFIVVDDTPGTIQINHPQFQVYNWSDRKNMLGELDSYFPRLNGACRNFGFYIAWHQSDEDEIILALDDDCQVVQPDFAADAASFLKNTDRQLWNGNGKHMNILDLYENQSPHLFPRGFPYHTRCHYKKWRPAEIKKVNASFNLGLWQGAFDINAIDKIIGPEWDHPTVSLIHDSSLIPNGTLISVCSMNMQFERDVLPAVFQFPMHIEIMPGWFIERYGDIWGGFVLKSLMDIREDNMVVGNPMINHAKDGNFQRNIWQEHLAHLVNEEFLTILDLACENIESNSYLSMFAALTENLGSCSKSLSPILSRYFKHLIPSMRAWIKALEIPF